jgi:anthranilate/para-aminobenzoate synthase component I
MIPCGSVTGAPKVRAMEIIASLEPFRRGLYTGAFGYVGRDGGLVLAMAIRTLEIAKSAGASATARYCTGGGIVADSDPERELAETRWKAAQLRSMVRTPWST